MAKNEHTGRNVAVGAAIAGAVGYLAGILTAPKSGKQTREDIAKKSGDIKDSVAGEAKERQEELAELLKRAKSETVAMSGKARGEFNEAVALAKDSEAKLRMLVVAVRKGEAEDPELNKAIKQAKAAGKNLSRYFKG